MSEKNGNITIETNPSNSQDSSLSVTAAQSQIIGVPFPILSPMFENASKTVVNKGSIWKVPRVQAEKQSRVAYMVMS